MFKRLYSWMIEIGQYQAVLKAVLVGRLKSHRMSLALLTHLIDRFKRMVTELEHFYTS